MSRLARTATTAGAVALILAGCESNRPADQVAAPAASAPDVSVPAASATPEAVVRAYVSALDAKDIAAAGKMLTSRHAEDVARATDSWFTNVRSLRALSVTPARTDPDHPGKVRVDVQLDLQMRSEISMSNGRTTWGYFLERDHADGRWLIADEGI